MRRLSFCMGKKPIRPGAHDGMVPRISIGWKTIQAPVSQSARLRMSHGRRAASSRERVVVSDLARRYWSQRVATRPTSRIRSSSGSSQVGAGPQQDRIQAGSPSIVVPRSSAARWTEGMTVPQLVSRWKSIWTSHIAKPIGTSVYVKRVVTCFQVDVVEESDWEALPANPRMTEGRTVMLSSKVIERSTSWRKGPEKRQLHPAIGVQVPPCPWHSQRLQRQERQPALRYPSGLRAVSVMIASHHQAAQFHSYGS